MAKSGSAPARVAVQSAPSVSAPAASRPRGAPMPWWRVYLLTLLTFALLGAVPLLVTGEFLGAWAVHLPGTPNLLASAPTPVPTIAPDLALPRQAWIASRVSVLPQPGKGSPLATLEPGFPVTLAAHQRQGSTVWSHISWPGPTSAAGGNGWVPDTALVAFAADTRPIGDLGALAPALAQALSPYGAAFSAVIYFPETGQLYRTRADTPFTLGTGFRAMLAAAAFAAAEAHHAPPPPTGATAPLARLAGGESTSGAATYTQVGGPAGMASYLSGIGVSGVQPSPDDWTTTQATATALVQFYAALAEGRSLSTGDRAALFALLAHADAATVSTVLGGGSPGNQGVLVVGTAQASGGWTANASGLIVPAAGPRFLVATAAQNQSSVTAAQQALATFFAKLTALLAAR